MGSMNCSPRIFQFKKAAAAMSFTLSSLCVNSPDSQSPICTSTSQIIKYKKLGRRKGVGNIWYLGAIKHSSSATTSIMVRCKYSESEKKTNNNNNVLLRVAWYGSEMLGIAASYLKRTGAAEIHEKDKEEEWVDVVISREEVVECIKHDFLRSYFVTGKLTVEAYEEECEFADPAGSFRGLKRFKRNCTNFGSLLLKSNMKLTKWQDFEDKGIGHWKFSCVMSFPWRPILSATGYTEYFFDAQTNKVSRHVEHWNVPKMALLKQIFKPTRWHWG